MLPKQPRRQPEAPLAPEALPSARRAADRPATAPAPIGTRKDRSDGAARGVRELDWNQFAQVAKQLSTAVARGFDPEAVVGVAKGGIFVGAEVARALKREFFPVRLHKRSRDHGPKLQDAAKTMPPQLRGRRVLIVDDIAGTGATLAAAVAAAKHVGALEVRTATLAVRKQGFRPDWFVIETDDLLVHPWDLEPTSGAVGAAADDLDGFGV